MHSSKNNVETRVIFPFSQKILNEEPLILLLTETRISTEHKLLVQLVIQNGYMRQASML